MLKYGRRLFGVVIFSGFMAVQASAAEAIIIPVIDTSMRETLLYLISDDLNKIRVVMENCGKSASNIRNITILSILNSLKDMHRSDLEKYIDDGFRLEQGRMGSACPQNSEEFVRTFESGLSRELSELEKYSMK